MSDLEKLYDEGLSLSKILDFISDELGDIIDGDKVTNVIECYRCEIADELRLCAHYRTTPEDINRLKKIIEGKKKIIAELEDKLLNALYEYMKKGRFVALAFNRINPDPFIIARREWENLEIFIETNSAFSEKGEYCGIRFIPIKQLNQLTANELKPELPLHSSYKKSDEPISKLAKELKTNPANSKPRKKLIPLQRVTNLTLELLYDIFDRYNINYLDELSANQAWAKIISGEFRSEHIKSIGETRTFLMLTDGIKLQKNEFSEKYRKRFKPE